MIHSSRAIFARTIAQKCYENMNKIDFWKCLTQAYLCLRFSRRITRNRHGKKHQKNDFAIDSLNVGTNQRKNICLAITLCRWIKPNKRWSSFILCDMIIFHGPLIFQCAFIRNNKFHAYQVNTRESMRKWLNARLKSFSIVLNGYKKQK